MVGCQLSKTDLRSANLSGVNLQGANLNSANLVGNVANANVALVVSQPAQPNITSVGTLTGLAVSGLLVASNGSGISNLNASNITGNVANANVALVVSQPAQPNITSVGTLTGLSVSGLLVAANGSGIANLNASNITGNVANGMTVDAGDRVALGGPKDARLCAHGGLSALGNSGRLNADRCPGRASKFLSSLEVDGAL